MNTSQMIMLLQFIFGVFQSNASPLESGFAAYVNVDNPKAAHSKGYYYLEDVTYNDEVVFSRRTPAQNYYIWSASPNQWVLGRNLGVFDGTLAGYCLYDPDQLGFTPHNDVRDCHQESGLVTAFWFEYYVKAYGSSGSYKLLGGPSGANNGYPVYIRDESNGDPRYIYRGSSGIWYIAATVNGGYYARCDEADLFDCDWFVLCLTADDADGMYQRTKELHNGRPWYLTADNSRGIYWTGSKWLIFTWDNDQTFGECDKHNIRGCDFVRECGGNGSNSNLTYFDYYWSNNCIAITIFAVLFILCIIKLIQRKNNKKIKYEMVSIESESDLENLKQ